MKRPFFITNQSDHAVNAVTAWLDRLGVAYVRMDTERFLDGNDNLSLYRRSTYNTRSFIYNETEIRQEEISAICYRRPIVNGEDNSEIQKFVSAQWKHWLWSLVTTFDGYWVNHPLWGKYLLEHNKLYQLNCASNIGLNIPDTIITNNAKHIRQFAKTHNNRVAVKPLCPSTLVSEDGNSLGIYTQLLRSEDFAGKDDSIQIAPMIVQQYISKLVEIRVTIIGKHIYSCEIHSQDSERTKHDWRRYDLENVKHLSHSLPASVEDSLIRLMKHFKLNFGAVDLILSPELKYYFLEVNPSGQYGWIEEFTAMPIS